MPKKRFSGRHEGKESAVFCRWQNTYKLTSRKRGSYPEHTNTEKRSEIVDKTTGNWELKIRA